MVTPGDAGEPLAAPEPPEERLADRLEAEGGPARGLLAEGLRQLGAVDRAAYAAIAGTPTPSLDRPVRWLSVAADNSLIWIGIATGMAVAGGPAGRRAALQGILAVGVTSAVVNLGIKSLYLRQRPDRAGLQVPDRRHVVMPSSTSFPSGHSASGFAFASAVGRDLPWLGLPLRFLAAAVAYSRVHTGVHYPGDTVIGSVVGGGIGQAVAGLTARLPRARGAKPRAADAA